MVFQGSSLVLKIGREREVRIGKVAERWEEVNSKIWHDVTKAMGKEDFKAVNMSSTSE